MHLFSAVGLVLVVLTAGCSSEPFGDADGGVPANMIAACTDGALNLCAGFAPARAVDYVGFRTESTTPRPATGDAGATGATEAAWTATLGPDQVGTPCGGASDRAACEDRLAKLRVLGDACQGVPIVPKDVASGAAEAPQQSGYCSTTYLVYTLGNDVVSLVDPVAVRQFLGTIDSPQEALYLVQASGESVGCGGSAPAAYREVEDGYEVQSATPLRCAGSTTQKILHVSRDGAITVVSAPSGERCSASY